jgi:type II secretory pathway pseudopilin PulG
MRNQKGISFIETAVALAILGIVAVAFLGSIGTSFKAVSTNSEQATAESLVISEVEYVKRCPYVNGTANYSVDPALDIPTGWSVSPPVVELVHAADDGIQEVTVKAEHNGNEILSLSVHKVDR